MSQVLCQARESTLTSTLGKRLLPMVLIQGYLWLTLLLFAVGPWQWPLRNPSSLLWFVPLCHFALFLGYLLVIHQRPVAVGQARRVNKWISGAIWITLAVMPITSYARTGQILPDLLGSIANPGQAYLDAHLFTEQGANAGAYVRILLSPILVALFPLAAFYWARLSRYLKLGTILLAIGTVIMAVSTGQRRDIADLLGTLPLLIVASHWAGVTVIKPGTKRWIGMGLIAALAAFTVYFAYSHVSRVGADTAAYGVNPATQQHPDRNNFLMDSLPEEAHPGFLAVMNYLTTGYYGLGLSLDRQSEPMYGFGHSIFLTRNFSRLTNDESFEQRSLPVIISENDGFKYPVYWCTAYPYFINDLGILGTIALMFGIGVLLALAWIDMLGGQNPLAIVMFWLLAVFVFYLPATNRMLQDGEGVVAFYIWLFAYVRSRYSARNVA